jgi:hypothetical protein
VQPPAPRAATTPAPQPERPAPPEATPPNAAEEQFARLLAAKQRARKKKE